MEKLPRVRGFPQRPREPSKRPLHCNRGIVEPLSEANLAEEPLGKLWEGDASERHISGRGTEEKIDGEIEQQHIVTSSGLVCLWFVHGMIQAAPLLIWKGVRGVVFFVTHIRAICVKYLREWSE